MTAKSAKKTGQKRETVPQSSASHLPDRQQIIDYIRLHPQASGKRELAKAFNLKGDKRIWLKNILRDLADEGVIERQKKRLIAKDGLPPVAILDIIGRSRDGQLLAKAVDQTYDKDIELRLPRDSKVKTVGVGDRILAKIFASPHDEHFDYSARVIRKIDKKQSVMLGVLRQLHDNDWRLEPVNRRDNEIKIDTNSLGTAKSGDLVEAEIGKDAQYGLKRGRITAIIGNIDSETALSMIAIHSHDIPFHFPQSVIDQANAAVFDNTIKREDWRDLPLITIDPADAKDHDDAVYATPDNSDENKGGFIVTVAIADVASYVRSGSDMDKEARKRGNSVYFPDRVVPMLPERISNDLCSLREHEDRPALAVVMVFNRDGHKINHKFHRILMRSHAKLSYNEAQSAIDGKGNDKTQPLLETVLRPLWDAYFCVLQARDQRQPLALDLPEKKIILDAQGRVDQVIVPARFDAHKLIEEFMIQANVCAAETLEAKHIPLLYRIHDKPSLAKQEGLRDFLRMQGLNLAHGADLSAAKINHILELVLDTPKQELVNQVVLRSQSQAEYNPDNIGHFGLNLRHYAHFTSPIRRYSDLIVHRALIRALHLGSDGLKDNEIEDLHDIATSLSNAERRAMAAERETVDRLIAHYLADHINAEFEARISGVTKAGLFVTLNNLGADGLIPISKLGQDYFLFDEGRHALIGERSHKGYQLGDSVRVRLVEALPIAGSMRFEMLTPPAKLPFTINSFHKSGKKPRAKYGAHKGRRR